MKVQKPLNHEVKIFYRILPQEHICWHNIKIEEDSQTIYIRSPQDLQKSAQTPQKQKLFYNFNTSKIFYNATQETIYKTTAQDVIGRFFEGSDAIIAAFGQTGTGKSLTVGGLYNHYEDRGIIPRIIEELFEKLAEINNKDPKGRMKARIQISYFEVCRNKINDLLQSYPNNPRGVKNVSKIKIKTSHEAIRYLFIGEGRKECADLAKYASNLASSLFTFHLTIRDSNFEPISLKSAKLHIVDFAGIDSVGNFTSNFKDPREISCGNLAKTQLEQFFLILTQNAEIPSQIKQHLNISPIIRFIGSSLINGDKSYLRFIGHINPKEKCLLTTLSMLKFGQKLTNLPVVKKTINNNNAHCEEFTYERIRSLESEIQKLKTLMMYESFLTNKNINSTNLDRDRFNHIRRTVDEYLQDKTNGLTLLTVSDYTAALEILKTICKSHKSVENVDKNEGVIIDNLVPSSGRRASKKSVINKAASDNVTTNKRQKSKIITPTSLSLGGLSPKRERSQSLKSNKSSLLKAPKRGSSKLSSRGSVASNSHNNKRKLSSNLSVYSVERRIRSESRIYNSNILPKIVPEYKDAWNCYVTKRAVEYENLRKLFDDHEAKAKIVNSNYLVALKALKIASAELDKQKNDMLLAKFTKNLHISDNLEMSDSVNIEDCCASNLKKAQDNLIAQQEVALEHQATLKSFMERCRDIKRELKERFDVFCKEEFATTVEDLDGGNRGEFLELEKTVMDINFENIIAEDEAISEGPREKFDRYKKLIFSEKRKKEMFKMKNKTWKS